MSSQARAPATHSDEEARAFLQSRVSLFWKVLFYINLLSVIVSVFGVVAEPGVDFLINIASTVQAGIYWFLCQRGKRSIRFSRAMETSGLLLSLTSGAFLGRYLLVQFSAIHSVAGLDGAVMTDAFISMLLVGGTTMLVSIRAALVPSSPRRTVLVTILAGVPVLVITAIVVPAAGGGLTWRALDSSAYPWLPATTTLMWAFAVLTSAIISQVIYGLRAEVSEARRLGQYVIERKLGEGGMGEVYQAHHGMMKRPTAIKLLRADRAGETNVRRFEREVQLTARLTHPNTITIFDYGRTSDDVFYYAMELLDGATLQHIVEVDGAQPAGRVVRLLSMACGALAEAHEIGLIHRDIKPANIMLCTSGGEFDVCKVLDFGLVKQLEVDRHVSLTGDNTVTGTPQYLAPESILDPNSVDARTDIYALGAVAYYLLAGVVVFEGKTVVEVCSQHLHKEPLPISDRGASVPSALEAVVLACLSKDPDHRPQSATELRRRIEACGVEPWDSARAHAWWDAHEMELANAPESSTSLGRTIAVARSGSA